MWVDDAAAQQLHDVAHRIAARLPHSRTQHATTMHVTLAFIGPLRRHKAELLASDLASLRLRPVEWTLTRVGAFRRARVVWADGPSQDVLLECADAVRSILSTLDIPFDSRPFLPHVTLLRRVDGQFEAESLEPVIQCCLGSPVVVESLPGPNGPHYFPIT